MNRGTWYVYSPYASRRLAKSQQRCTPAYLHWQGLNAGPPLVGALDDTYEDMWVQGVGGPYTGSTAANFLPLGTNQESIDEAKRLFTMAHDKCPDSVVLAGGYRCAEQTPGI
ncbi:cutinase family protein [Candidatus Bathyarchaeota archaeon]|nr:cutinase family protein [Candidatus Bathyarchaeota archaeon]